MDEAEIKARLQRDVNALDFDSLWGELESRRWVGEVLSGETGYEDLVDEATALAGFQRRTLEAAGGYSGSRPGRPERKAGEGTPEPWEMADDSYAVEMARTYSSYLAVRAAKRENIEHFRDSVLGGEMLAAEEVAGFVERHAESGSGLYLEYLDADGGVCRLEVRPHSEADWLRRRVAGLVRSYPWTVAQATAFVLTGEPPEVPPLIGYSRDDGISISASPWVSEREISRFFHYLQRRVRGDKDNRPVSERARDVLLFVSERMDRRGERPGWGELLAAWNAANPERTFTDRAGFMRTYERAHRALLSKEPPVPWR